MKTQYVFCLAIILASSSFSFSQRSKAKPNPEIVRLVKEVSAKNIEATIRKLSSFGTRNTLSEQDNPTRGIGAALDVALDAAEHQQPKDTPPPQEER